MKKKVLITGGAGFIGSALVKKLVKTGSTCVVFDDFSRGRPRRLESVEKDIELISGDIRDSDAVQNSMKGVDSVLHLAYINGTEFFYTKPDQILDVGIRGMLNVIDACEKHKVGELILASSSEVYQSADVIPTPEDVPMIVPDAYNPRYSYGGGKISCELMAIHMAKFMERVVIFRPHNVYGPDMGWEHVIPQFSTRLLETQKNGQTGPVPFKIQGTGEETRSFIYIDDFSEAILTLMAKGVHMNTYHIGTMEELTIASLAEKCARTYNIAINIKTGDIQKGSTLRRCPDISKIEKLGFKPSLNIDQGLEPTLMWYKENIHLQPEKEKNS